MRLIFWGAWAIDALITIVAAYLFFTGLFDESASLVNLRVLAFLFCALASVVCGSLWFRAADRPLFGLMLLLVPALPGSFLGAVFLMLAVSNGPRWY